MPELDFEKITLNAIPDGEMPVFHASQFETMRPFIADLKWGSEVFAPGEGCWCTLSIRKTDDTLVIIDDIDIVTNTVSCILTQQSVACVGDNFCQLKVWSTEDDEDKCIACLNFILHVQPDPEAGGITSESEINNLTEQIEEITQQVIGDDYYDKTEVDDLLDDKADKSDTYTKSQVDTALNLKADKSTTYTKTQVDSALALKADKSTTYTKTQVDNALALKANSADLATVATTGDYDDLTNKPTIPAAQVQSDYEQADNTKVDYIKNKPDLSVFVTSDALSEIIYDLLPAGTTSGAIANFDTDLSLPLVECVAYIVATGGNGTPDSPIPINGYSEANIVNTQNESIVDLFSIDSDFRGTVAFNQFADDNISSGSYANVQIVKNNNGSITLNGTSTARAWLTNYNIEPQLNHKYLLANGVGLTMHSTSWGLTSDRNKEINISNCNSISPGERIAIEIMEAGLTYNNKTVFPQIIDLTQMFGSTIADYIYSLEQATTGAGVAFFRNIYPADYYDYDSGTTEIVGKETPEATIAFGQTVYGGVLDVTRGKLKPCIEYPSYNGETLSGRWLSSEATYIEGTTPPTGSQVVSLDDYGTDIDLTPVQINALMGVNNVYNDTNGDTEVSYKDTIQHYIDTRI